MSAREPKHRILVVGDDAMVGMLLEDMVLDCGDDVIGPVARFEDAPALARAAEFDVAVLDLNLNGTLSYPIAEVIRCRGIPIILVTGYGLEGLRDGFQGCPTLQKPSSQSDFAQAVAAVWAQRWQLTREEQDQFATASQNKAEAAQKEGRFKDEITPVTIASRKGDIVVDQDEYIRAGTTIDALAKLRPAFSKEGTVTAGNASGINDGAAALVLMTEAEAQKRGLTPLARIASWATAGVDPAIMGTGPIPSSRKALEKAGWKVQDLELVEANEAFAAQALAVNKDMGWDPSIVNVNGGAIAIGHPIGASGARVLVTLLHEMGRRNAKKGLATLCIGGGMGVAMCLER